MKNNRKNSRFRRSTLVLLAVAVLLLAGSAIGSTRAALTYFSENYVAEMNVQNIGVSLIENGSSVKNDGQLLGSLSSGEIEVGKPYDEKLQVMNTGNISQYVRVTLYKSWTDTNGRKDTLLSPSYIDLNMNPEGGWVEDTEAATAERSVWYYTSILNPGDTTTLLADQIRIDNALASEVTTETKTEGTTTTTTTTYTYNGYNFTVKAVVDAVQDHNAEDAIKSAWGVDAEVSGGTLSLK